MTTHRARLAHLTLALVAPTVLAGCSSIAVAADRGARPTSAVAAVSETPGIGSTCHDLVNVRRAPLGEAAWVAAWLDVAPHTRHARRAQAEPGLQRTAVRVTSTLRQVADEAGGPALAALVDDHAESVEDAVLAYHGDRSADTDRIRATGQVLVETCAPYTERFAG